MAVPAISKWSTLNHLTTEDKEVDVFGETVQQVRGDFAVMHEEEVQEKVGPAPFPALTITIPHYKSIEEGEDLISGSLTPRSNSGYAAGVPSKKKSYIAYVIRCTGATGSWEVLRRFSEFYTLHTTLMGMKTKGQRSIPMFPSRFKRFLESESTLIQRRRKVLGDYLSQVWALYKQGMMDAAGPTLEDFLRTDSAVTKGRACSVGASQRRGSRAFSLRPGNLTPRDAAPRGRAATPRMPPLPPPAQSGGVIVKLDTIWAPNVTVVSDNKEHMIVLEVPGCSQADLTLTVLDSGIRVYGERKLDIPNQSILHNDRIFGTFALDFPVPDAFAPFRRFSTHLHLGYLYLTFKRNAGAAGDDELCAGTAAAPRVSPRYATPSPSNSPTLPSGEQQLRRASASALGRRSFPSSGSSGGKSPGNESEALSA